MCRTSSNVKGSLVYKSNLKGHSILNLITKDINVLYTLALDTQIPKKILSGKQSHFESYSNAINKKTNYPTACIKTTLTFISLINLKNDAELELIVNEKEIELFQLHIRLSMI